MNKSFLIAASIIIVVIGIVFYLSSGKPDNSKLSPENASPTAQTTPILTPTLTEKSDNINSMNEDQKNELIIEDLKVGTGTEASEGKKVTVNYKGVLVNGVQFDSSYDRGTPFTFTLGKGEVISGWDQGVAGMKVGGIRKLTIPPSLGYGNRDMGSIPANSTIIFEVELLKVE